MNIICQECGSIYVGNEIPQGLICMCKSNKFKLK